MEKTENQGNNLFAVPISYGANQTNHQTLVPPPRDQPKHQKPSRDQLKDQKPKTQRKKTTRPTTTQNTTPQPTRGIVGTKRHTESTDHGNDDAKRFKRMENTIPTEIPTVEVEAQPRRAQ